MRGIVAASAIFILTVVPLAGARAQASSGQAPRAAPPATTVKALDVDQIETISIAKPAKAPAGKNAAISFHLSRNAMLNLKGQKLPDRLTVGINGKPQEAYDLTGSGVYTVYQTLKKAPTSPAVFDAHTGKAITPVEPEFLKVVIKVVPCAPGCVSVIFHTRCIVCVQVSIEI